MADRLKDIFFTRESLMAFAESVKRAEPTFQPEVFLRMVFGREWDTLELKDRMHRVAVALHDVLPSSYPRALEILRKVAPSVKGFECMVFPDFVEMYGQDDWDRSLPALGYFTRFGSSEFAVRPFLVRDPARAMEWMHRWAADADPKVRRLTSEGTRPRLPWAMALPAFKKDPAPVLALLERLKQDPDESVRRSVANNLNDIAKDNPTATLEVCERWYGLSAETDRIVRHACRGLLKRGNRRAMKLFGLKAAPDATIRRFRISPAGVRIGSHIHFSFEVNVKGKKRELPVKLRLEYRIGFSRPNGKTSSKVFQLSEREYGPGNCTVRKKHAFVDLSTRKHHPGVHTIAVLLNGVEQAKGSFRVLAARRGGKQGGSGGTHRITGRK